MAADSGEFSPEAAKTISTLRCKLYVADYDLGKLRSINDHLWGKLEQAEDMIRDLKEAGEEQDPGYCGSFSPYGREVTINNAVRDELEQSEYARIKAENEYTELAMELVDMKVEWLAACRRAKGAKQKASAIEKDFQAYRLKVQLE